jgi:hypothetical protein
MNSCPTFSFPFASEQGTVLRVVRVFLLDDWGASWIIGVSH